MNRPILVEFWRHVLVENGYSGGAEGEKSSIMSYVDAVAMSLCLTGEERLASLLVDNAVTKLSHLADAEHPQDWVGAAAIEEVELDFVWGLRSKARQRSRCVSFALCALRLACCALLAGRAQSGCSFRAPEYWRSWTKDDCQASCQRVAAPWPRCASWISVWRVQALEADCFRNRGLMLS